MLSSSDWNRVRFDPRARGGHVESYFFKLNDPSGRRALWLKATILARPECAPVAEAWAIAFDRESEHRAAKRVVPFGEASFSQSALDVRVAELAFHERRIEGRVQNAGRRIDVSLDFDPGAPPLVPFFSRKMYEARLPSSKLVSPHPDSRFKGEYRADGEPVHVDGWRGMQGHNWGRHHAEQYAWAHCNQWDGDQDVVLEALTARVKMGPVLTPPVTIVCVWHRGRRYEFNQPKTLLASRGTMTARSFRFEARQPGARVSGELSADTRDFVGLYYENPNGQMTYCLNSKIADARLRLEVDGEPPLELATHAAALELGTKDPNHGVAMLA
jgi:Tocopherol cyclase